MIDGGLAGVRLLVACPVPGLGFIAWLVLNT